LALEAQEVSFVPSEEHELLAERLPGNHALLRRLLRDACGLELSTLSPLPGSEKVRNTNLPELRSDGVVLEVDGERVMSVTVFEPQLSKDDDKRLAWPCYMVGFRAQYRVPVRVVVVAPTRAVARWAARPIVLDDGGSVVTPIVIGPDQIPRIDAEGVDPSPELAVLSTMAHGRSRAAVSLGRAALAALRPLPPEWDAWYTDMVLRNLSKRARARLEAEMRPEDYEIKNPVVKEFFSRARAKGEAEGEAKGEARGLARALLEVLERRSIEVDETLSKEVLACRDEARLLGWIEKAATANDLADVFD
jgi:hypothetical protein